jgi:hypothetical protein
MERTWADWKVDESDEHHASDELGERKDLLIVKGRQYGHPSSLTSQQAHFHVEIKK